MEFQSRPPKTDKWCVITRTMVVCLWFAFQSAALEQEPNQSTTDSRFVGVDTSRLMGSPDPFPLMQFELAFPNLHFNRPVMPTHAGDGSNRMFVVTQDGLIYVFPVKSEVMKAKLFLDIRTKVSRPGGDNGMFAVAFHPKFRSNRSFFVVYTTRSKPKSTVVSRFDVLHDNPDKADVTSEREILRIRQPFADHNAACLAFGPDGMLYVALGDGGYNIGNKNAQDRTTLLGSMLRINVDLYEQDRLYTIPGDNPFVTETDVRGEIWAFGLRAPWRFSFDRLTGDCWLGDNGQVEFEEINLVRPGHNYGWMPREGLHAFDPSRVDPRGRPAGGINTIRKPDPHRDRTFTDPTLEYDHTKGKSVVGGLVYRGSMNPSLVGAYIYGDYQNGNIWALRWDGEKVVENKLIARTRLNVTSFGEDQAGELYFTAFNGKVYVLRPAPPESNARTFPQLLSETGLFESVPDLKPVAGMIPYSVNVPLWSDGAIKQRYLALPDGANIVYDEDGPWQFPLGTVFVKTFVLPGLSDYVNSPKRIETRLFVKNPRGWVGYTYRWNQQQTEARLLGGAASVSLPVTSGKVTAQQSWYFPSREDCVACHTRSSGFVLGMNTRQLNRAHKYGGVIENQLVAFDRLGIFSEPLSQPPDELPAFPDWQKQIGTVKSLARSYLDVNCAMCHTPPGFTKIDLRHTTPLAQTCLVGLDPEKPRVGPIDSKLLTPGDPERSEMFLRMTRKGPGRMPNLATSLVDEKACNLIREWIESLKGAAEAPRQ